MTDAAKDPGPLSFSSFILGLSSTALIHMGVAPNPETGKTEKNLAMARQTIDLLDMLKRKTAGNLDKGEEQLFTSLLTDLRTRFVSSQS